MNVCNEGGSIVIFPDEWSSRNEPQHQITHPNDPAWLDYCRAREFAERSAAKQATCVHARRVHQQLAQAYAKALRTRA